VNFARLHGETGTCVPYSRRRLRANKPIGTQQIRWRSPVAWEPLTRLTAAEAVTATRIAHRCRG
jgi:hypothetical protein